MARSKSCSCFVKTSNYKMKLKIEKHNVSTKVTFQILKQAYDNIRPYICYNVSTHLKTATWEYVSKSTLYCPNM